MSKSTPEIERMVRDIEYQIPLASGVLGRDTLDRRVLAAMRKVPRHEFVPADEVPYAYDDGPLPIGCGQTVSQPFIVALMTDLLRTRPDHVVLEVGTGSGYQSAVLSQLVKQVYSTEIHCELADKARERLSRLAYRNVEIRCGDGYYGWNEFAPFDGIIVTAAAPHVPPPLVEQLKPGGRLLIPLGWPHLPQELLLLEKGVDGQVTSRDVLSVAFVPLTGEHPAV